MPDLPLAVYPGSIQNHSQSELKGNIEKILDQIVDGITKPAPVSHSMRSSERDAEISVFEGTLDEVNSRFILNKWSDGHPIIPPTADRVSEFLKYTDRAPDEVIATLPISYSQATPRNIAVNGVMAGCPPQCMPILIAAAEALGDPGFDITGLGSTGGYMPFLVINGPIARQLDIRSDLPAISHPTNAVIGRAIGLIVRNIGGFIPGDTAMGTLGYILPFVFAEDEEACREIGWEPYHARNGFERNANVLTLGGSGNWGHQSTPTGEDAKILVEYGVREVARRVIAERAVKRLDATSMFAMVITPPVAKVLAKGGYSIAALTHYWFHHATITRREYDFRSKYGQSSSPAPTIQSLVADGTLQAKWFDKGIDEMVPMLPTPDTMHVFVSGDRGRNKYMSFWAPYFTPALKQIKLPAKWEELLKQARK